MESNRTLGALGSEYHLKQEIKRCHLCNDWIFNKIYHINRCNKILYFHEFCYNNLNKKNAFYKSIYNSTIQLADL
jgi:hypothetical protein